MTKFIFFWKINSGGQKSKIRFHGLKSKCWLVPFDDSREESISLHFQLLEISWFIVPFFTFKVHHSDFCFHHHIISSAVKSPSASSFFFLIFIYLPASSLSCSIQASLSGGMGASESVASEVEVCRLSCPVACGWDLSFPNRDQAPVPCIWRQILNHWTSREVQLVLLYFLYIKSNHLQIVTVLFSPF